jgi:hypothetical protein
VIWGCPTPSSSIHKGSSSRPKCTAARCSGSIPAPASALCLRISLRASTTATFVGNRLFVSNISGYVTEILEGGKTRDLVPEGFNFPLGLAVAQEGISLCGRRPVLLHTSARREERRRAGFLFAPGYPGYSRGVAAAGPGEFIVTTANGEVARYWPEQQRSEVLASGLRSAVRSCHRAARGGDLRRSRARAACTRFNQATCKCSPRVSRSPPALPSAQMTPASWPNRRLAEWSRYPVVGPTPCSMVCNKPQGIAAARRVALYRRCGLQRADRMRSGRSDAPHDRRRSARRRPAGRDSRRF